MPIIRFDVLIPDTHDQAPQKVKEAFELALQILVDAGRLSTGAVTPSLSDAVPADVVAELREVYEREHGAEAGETTMHRFDISAEGEGVSFNDLAMSLSRIFTPRVDLPGDRIAEERQEDFEVASIYPWLVEIVR